LSLILDALRRADAERQAGQVPGLHAQPLPAPPHEPPTRRHAVNWRWALVGAIVGLALPVGWYIAGSDAPRGIDQPVLSRAPPAPPAPVHTPAPAPAGTVPATRAMRSDSAAPTVAARSPAQGAESPSIAEPAPWPEREPGKAPKRATAAPAAGAAVQADVGRDAGTPPPASPVYDREQLPQEIRAALPALSIGGSIYSPNPLDRTLIVNGRLYRENDVLAPDLALEQIQQRSAIFRYRGYRFLLLF